MVESGQRFALRYRLVCESGSFNEREVLEGPVDPYGPDANGGCDAMVVLSILRLADGSSDTNLFSIDGRSGEPVNPADTFAAWIAMGEAIAQNEATPPWLVNICLAPKTAFDDFMKKRR